MRHARSPLSMLALLLALAAPAAAQQAEGGERESERRPQERARTEARTAGERATRRGAYQDDPAVGEAVRAVVSKFGEALRSGDSTLALDLLHPEARIYESGHAETKEEYRSGHLAADMAFLSDVTREVIRDTVVSGRAMALYLSESRASGDFRGREVDSRGVETIVLVPTDGGWKIRHIHWSSR